MNNTAKKERLNEIEKTFEKVLAVLKEERQEKYEEKVHRRAGNEKIADWSTENARINWIRIYLGENYPKVSYCTSFLSSYYNGVYDEEYTISSPYVCKNVELFEDPDEADAFLSVCAKACIEEWSARIHIEHRMETVDTLFSELFDTPYFEDFYDEHDDFEPGEEYSASARGFVNAIKEGKYPTYGYLMSLERE